MAELIKMSFGLCTRVGSGNHALDEGLDPKWEGTICGEAAAEHCKVSRDNCLYAAAMRPFVKLLCPLVIITLPFL